MMGSKLVDLRIFGLEYFTSWSDLCKDDSKKIVGNKLVDGLKAGLKIAVVPNRRYLK